MSLNIFVLVSLGGNSTIMIAVICSLLGVVLIGLILLFIYVKKKRKNQPRRTQQQLTSPMSGAYSQRNHSELPRQSPPPYSSVVANAPPPYSSSTTIHGRPTYT